MSTHVRSRLDGAIGTVTIDRPEKLNALSSEIESALREAFAALAEQDALVVILRTTGDAFIAGADLGEIDGLSHAEFVDYQKNGRRTNDAIEAHPAMVIAAVDGLAYGGGLEKALAADLIVASEDATFAVPEVKLGLIPGGGATQRLPRRIGAPMAKEMLTTGEPLSADEALRCGLVNHVVPDDAVEERVRDLAEDIASNAPMAVREAKRVVDQGLEAGLETGLSFEQEVTFTLYNTEDVQEGIEAFVEKRDPEFRGQ